MSTWDPSHSPILSLLLDEVTGTQEAEDIRKDFCILDDSISSSFNKQKIHFTGSKAEGLDLPGSDRDYMLEMNDVMKIKVVQSLSDAPNFTGRIFYLQTEDVNPGFALLHLIHGGTWRLNPLWQQIIQILNGIPYLSSNLFVNTFLNMNMCNDRVCRTGPSIEHWTTLQNKSESGTDLVLSIHCDFWPSVAIEWPRRQRHFGWPQPNVISSIVEFGCHLVAIGHPNSGTQFMEWRLSFSLAEKHLVWTFNHVQMQCYAVMKIVLKEFIKERCSKHNQVLCSYFVKTFLFWEFESTDLNFWCESNLMKCIMYLFNTFSKCIRDGVLRHYFLPNFNLLSVKLTPEAQAELLHLFEIIIKRDVDILKECKTLRNVWSRFVSANENQMGIIHNARRKNLFETDRLIMKAFLILSLKIGQIDSRGEILNEFRNKLPLLNTLSFRQEILDFFANASVDQIIAAVSDIPCKTCLKHFVIKELHFEKQLRTLHDLIKTNHGLDLYNIKQITDDSTTYDISTCKLWYAILLLKMGDYASTLNTVKELLSNLPPFVICESAIVNSCESVNLYVDKFMSSSCTTLERGKEAWLRNLIFTKRRAEILPTAIQLELFYLTHLEIQTFISPFIVAYYLMFVSYHELGQYDDRNRVLEQLVDSVNNLEQCGLFHHTCNIAGHCLLIAGHTERAIKMFCRSIKFTKKFTPHTLNKYNSAWWYFTNWVIAIVSIIHFSS